MSADSSWDVQTGVYAHLAGTAAVTGLLAGGAAGILDHVPPGTNAPYVVIGDLQAQPMDTQGGSGNDVTLNLHVYSRGSGMQEARGIMAALYDALHNASFSVPDQTLILCQCQGGGVSLEADGVTRHGVLRFQIITEPV